VKKQWVIERDFASSDVVATHEIRCKLITWYAPSFIILGCSPRLQPPLPTPHSTQVCLCVYDVIDSSYWRIVVCIFHVVDVKIVFGLRGEGHIRYRIV
jgi:hypothetical protein